MTGERVDPVVPLDPDRLDAIAGSASSITDARRRWDAHWRDGECGGERCLGDRSWANYDDARLLAQLQRVKRQEQSDD